MFILMELLKLSLHNIMTDLAQTYMYITSKTGIPKKSLYRITSFTPGQLLIFDYEI